MTTLETIQILGAIGGFGGTIAFVFPERVPRRSPVPRRPPGHQKCGDRQWRTRLLEIPVRVRARPAGRQGPYRLIEGMLIRSSSGCRTSTR